jgi:UDP-N-acetylglucosamine 1-carboxyvinyltransferase
MSKNTFLVEGNARLNGEIHPQGAKNEALQIISAVLLSSDKITIHNLPEILDVMRLIDLLRGLGVKVERLKKSSWTFQADQVDIDHFSSEEYQSNARKIRGSVMLLGPTLARFGKAFLPKPGGDKIGRRRLDTHFIGFQKMGAEFVYDEANDKYFLDSKGLQGKYILMDEISVTGTANIVMAAVLAHGTTTIYNAACEPYLQQLCKMLNAMGARISGVGSNLLVIEGVNTLGGTTHTILPDMIEIGSFIGMAAMTASPLRIKNVSLDNLGIIPATFEKLGIQLQYEDDDIIVPQQDIYEIQTFIDGSIMTIYDAPWPGFTPDLLSIILVVAIQARGSLLVHQKMFESRLFFVDKLIDMGARIILCDPHRATVIGLERKHQLKGIEMSSPDIRAGVSLLIAALSAKGQSLIHNINQIDRGYEAIDERLNALGANIQRIEVS